MLPKGLPDDGGRLLFSGSLRPPWLPTNSRRTAHPRGLPDSQLAGKLAGIEFGVEFESTAGQPPRGVPAPRRAVVRRAQLFPPDTKVASFAAPDDLAGRPVMTFSASTVMDSLRRSYTQSALVAVDDLPLIAPPAVGLVASDDQPFADVFNAVRDPANQFLLSGDDQTSADGFASLVGEARRASGDTGMVEVIPGGRGPAGEIARAMAFHRGPQSATAPRVRRNTA